MLLLLFGAAIGILATLGAHVIRDAYDDRERSRLMRLRALRREMRSLRSFAK